MSDRPRFLFALSPHHLNNVHLQHTSFRALWSVDREEQSCGEKAVTRTLLFNPRSPGLKKLKDKKNDYPSEHKELYSFQCHAAGKIIISAARMWNSLNSSCSNCMSKETWGKKKNPAVQQHDFSVEILTTLSAVSASSSSWGASQTCNYCAVLGGRREWICGWEKCDPGLHLQVFSAG